MYETKMGPAISGYEDIAKANEPPITDSVSQAVGHIGDSVGYLANIAAELEAKLHGPMLASAVREKAEGPTGTLHAISVNAHELRGLVERFAKLTSQI